MKNEKQKMKNKKHAGEEKRARQDAPSSGGAGGGEQHEGSHPPGGLLHGVHGEGRGLLPAYCEPRKKHGPEDCVGVKNICHEDVLQLFAIALCYLHLLLPPPPPILVPAMRCSRIFSSFILS